MPRKEQKPGDMIIDRCLPRADAATRERAREKLKQLARIVLKIAIRRAREPRSAKGSSEH